MAGHRRFASTLTSAAMDIGFYGSVRRRVDGALWLPFRDSSFYPERPQIRSPSLIFPWTAIVALPVRNVQMSSWTRTHSCASRLRSRLSFLHVVTVGAVISLCYLFYTFAVPQLHRLQLRTDLSWYDLGLYGFGPSRSYVSFEYESPAVQISEWESGCDSRYTFFAPRGDSVAQPGPMILDSKGELVWMKYNWDVTQDFKVQRYQDTDYLTYWEGGETEGRGYGAWYMLDSTYTQRYVISPVGNHGGDLHEFNITPEGTALVTIYDPLPADLTSIGGPELGWIYDGVFQEIDIATGELIFEWRASEHYPISITYEKLGKSGRLRSFAFDFYHINSVDKDDNGNYIVSARHTHTVSCIDKNNGQVLWTLGGKLNEFRDLSDGKATNFAWQHDARWHANNTLTLFDNARHSSNDPENESRGMAIELNVAAREASLRAAYHHPQQMLSVSQGNVQMLDDSGRVLVEWGHSAAFSEFSADGQLLCNTHFGASAFFGFGRVVSYRAFKGTWVGRPQTVPDAEVLGDRVYVSWNGATEVVAWRLEVWETDDVHDNSFRVVAQFPKDSFETEIEIPNLELPLFRLAALDSDGNVLGITELLQREQGGSFEQVINPQYWIIVMAFVMSGVGLFVGLYTCCGWGQYFRRCRSRSSEYQLVAFSDSEAPV
ncbi:arylsulfotransferase family protein [Aspergillus ibericus CBS 121593]|uniref:Arylsulfotransferase n=1 Tax=Aspergillus ibericus CBS 121593 TaxID=1448316 RepID=A0A395H0X9_9EURO|nr:hypothetical protein BO80DRAFT_465679 [Aspergillus ibericus CBS 121593]RAK99953.1 hypothetical protein BO80DRAFT_465679 [Aspergillus ibericus CBS 121593]